MICQTDFLPFAEPTSVALGFFDGVHRGHQEVLSAAVSAAREKALSPAVFTFTVGAHSDSAKTESRRLLTSAGQLARLEELGFRTCLRPPFEAFSHFTPIQFVKQILCDTMRARVVFCGENYRFGTRASGDAPLLVSLCALFDVQAFIVPTCMEGGAPISSTRVRKALARGDMEQARALLGAPWQFEGEVVRGSQLGRAMHYPTLNQWFPKELVLPPFGVYVSMARVDGVWCPSVTNIGLKPTVGRLSSPLAETNILDFDGDLYGKTVSVALFHFLRGEKKFPSVEALFTQIAEDSRFSRRYFEKNDFSFG